MTHAIDSGLARNGQTNDYPVEPQGAKPPKQNFKKVLGLNCTWKIARLFPALMQNTPQRSATEAIPRAPISMPPTPPPALEKEKAKKNKILVA
jgi:hypothetical protein